MQAEPGGSCELRAGQSSPGQGVWLLEGEVTISHEEQQRGLTSVSTSPKGIWDTESRLVTRQQISAQGEEGRFAN